MKTDPCLKDTDGDDIEDGFEYRSAVDLNDDEFQSHNTSLPYPGKRPYPNPLDPSDPDVSYDGDTLTQGEEQALWRYAVSLGAARTLSPLEYSDGEQHSKFARGSDGRRFPTLAATGYAKSQSFKSWASAGGYDPVELSDGPPWYSGVTRNSYSLFDFDRSGTATRAELLYYDFDANGYLSDDERDEDADGLTNYDEPTAVRRPLLGGLLWNRDAVLRAIRRAESRRSGLGRRRCAGRRGRSGPRRPAEPLRAEPVRGVRARRQEAGLPRSLHPARGRARVESPERVRPREPVQPMSARQVVANLPDLRECEHRRAVR